MRDLIIDGYNVLHAVDRYTRLMADDLGLARRRLVDDVASFAAGAYRAVVVFDGAGPFDGGSEHSVPEVRVVFSPPGVDADSVVESLAREVRDRGGDAVVVTSDATTQWTVLGGGVVRMSARELEREMADDTAERSERNATGSSRSTLSERVDAETHSALIRIRDRRG